MELRESIESINKRLISEFGRELNGKPKFRVVFSEDQYEKRITEFTDEGFELLQPEVRLLPKYKQWVKAKYILERFVPVVGETDLLDNMSYEPVWVFQDKNGNYLPPFFEGCSLIIEGLYERTKKTSFAKYKDESVSKEARLAEVERVERELFGNETDVGDALAYGSGVTVPGLKVEEAG